MNEKITEAKNGYRDETEIEGVGRPSKEQKCVREGRKRGGTSEKGARPWDRNLG